MKVTFPHPLKPDLPPAWNTLVPISFVCIFYFLNYSAYGRYDNQLHGRGTLQCTREGREEKVTGNAMKW